MPKDDNESPAMSTNEKRLINIGLNSNDVMWFTVISNKLRHDIIRTILGFIGNVYGDSFGELPEKVQNWRITSKEDQYELFEIDPPRFMKHFAITAEIFHCQVSVYYHKKFHQLFEQTGADPLDLSDAFNSKNSEKIISKLQSQDKSNEAAAGEGGASGELFVIDLEKKFILKTITYEESRVFNRLIEDRGFFDHVIFENASSIMPRIYGYLEFNFTKLGNKKQYVIIMEN